MKKLLLSTIIAISAMLINVSETKAQYEKGDKLLNLGIGLNSYYFGGIPLAGALEIGITDEISVGGAVGFQSNNYFGSRWTSLYFGGRGSYHLNEILNLNKKELDIYGGAQLGIQTFKWNSEYSGLNTYNNNNLRLGVFGGGRYYFKNNLAAYGEFGFGGYSNANIGITLKF